MRVKESSNAEHVYQTIENADRHTKQAIRRMWFNLGDDLANRAKSEILKPKSGRVYLRRRGGRLVRHRASAPGETHANDTGALRRAVSWKVYGWEEMGFGYGVGGQTSPYYDLFVEFGTRRMQPRPSLKNAIDWAQANVQLRFDEEIKKEFGS